MVDDILQPQGSEKADDAVDKIVEENSDVITPKDEEELENKQDSDELADKNEDKASDVEDKNQDKENADESAGVDDATPDKEDKEISVDEYVDALVDAGIDTTNTQKRFDQLTAKIYELEEKLASAKSADAKTERVYSEAELSQLEAQALRDNDVELMSAVSKQRLLQLEKKMTKKVEDMLTAPKKEAQKAQREWESVVSAFAHLQETEIYSGSKKDLNITDPNSMLMKVAGKLYYSDKQEAKERYRKTGGMHLAVGDAVRLILKDKLGKKVSSKQEKVLRRKLKKERRNNLVPEGSAGSPDNAPAKSSQDYSVKAEVERRTAMLDSKLSVE